MALLQKAYLGATPLFRNTSFFEDNAYTVSNRSSRVTVTGNASAHVKGSWVQLIASTSADASVIYIEPQATSNGNDSSTLLDIGIGASGSETALISNIAVGGMRFVNAVSSSGFAIPIQVASGTRLSARVQSVITSFATGILVETRNYGDYAQAPTSVDVIGTNTATSEGTNFVANNTYVELKSSTSRAYRGVIVLPNVSGNFTGDLLTPLILAQGASGSEVEIQAVYAGFSSAETCNQSGEGMVPVALASGTRLAVKGTGFSGTIANFGVSLIGIP